MAALTQTYASTGCTVHTYGSDTVIVTISKAITTEALWASITAGRSLTRENGRGVAALTVIESGSEVPGAEVRKEINRVVELSRAYTRCSAQVLRGQGFWLSAVRSLLTAIELLRPGDLPRRVFDDVTPAALFMAKHIERDMIWAQGLAQAMRSVTRPTHEFAAAE